MQPEVFQNEFAMVEVSRYQTVSGPRLHIRDLASGTEVFLDPFELEGLTRVTHGDFVKILDPNPPLGDVVWDDEPSAAGQ
ncbi:MAG: hypothetical protein M3524_02785 [Actinomycetota bacterium]|jgi:hypothetical protein|nr:hypothetical protein [Actinomycetota bacterium]